MRYGATQAVWKRHSNKMTSEVSGFYSQGWQPE